MAVDTNGERAGLEMVKVYLASGANMRQLKKWLDEELAALDAERYTELDEDTTDYGDIRWD